jgi:hypothetical protein
LHLPNEASTTFSAEDVFMKAKKRKDAAPKETEAGDTQSLNYEELLNGFASEDEKKNDTTVTRGDLDGLALAELLSEEEQQVVNNASGSFDTIAAEDYSSLARQFDDLDLSALAEEAGENIIPETEAPDQEAIETVDISTRDSYGTGPDTGEESEDYSAFLEDLEKTSETAALPAEEQDDTNLFDLNLPDETVLEAVDAGEPDLMNLPELDDSVPATDNIMIVEPEAAPEKESVPTGDSEVQEPPWKVLDIVNLADDSGYSEEASHVLAASPETEKEIEPVPEPESLPYTQLIPEGAIEEAVDEEEGVFSLNDLFEKTDSSAEQVKTPLQSQKSAVESKPAEQPDNAEVDFLGISSVVPGGKASKRIDASMEVLFDGVEMSFSEQIDLVTLGELLLAQGKKNEAVECFRKVAKKKGTTNWVAKRLRLLAPNIEK